MKEVAKDISTSVSHSDFFPNIYYWLKTETFLCKFCSLAGA